MCKDVDVANKVAHRDNLDGVTMEGTQVSKKGVFKGGFHDLSRCVMCRVSCCNIRPIDRVACSAASCLLLSLVTDAEASYSLF